MANNGTGKRSRFADRLNKIRRNRIYKRKNEDAEEAYKNILKVMAVIPMVVIDNVFDKPKDNKKSANVSVPTPPEESNIKERRRKKIEAINKIDISLIKEKQMAVIRDEHKSLLDVEDGLSNDNGYQNDSVDIDKKNVSFPQRKQNVFNGIPLFKNIFSNKETENNIKTTTELTDNSVKILEKKIIDLIKKDLIKVVNELEILESELYILSEVDNDEKELDECRKNLAEVKKILAKIDKLKMQYDYLRDNYDFEYLLEIDNHELIDNIIELKNKFERNEVIATVEDYKLLDVYKYLYIEIDKIHESTENLQIEKEKKELELKDRDIDFNKLRNDVYSVDRVNASYNSFVKEQNAMLEDMEKEISKISSHEVDSYRLKGFGKFLFTSFKYLNLLMLNPLKGVVPAIATETLVTRNVLTNLKKDLKWEEVRRIEYEAIDYANALNEATSNLDLTDRMIDSSLEDIVRLKVEYNHKFRQYHGDFLQYREVISKIDDMENKMIGNKIKIGIMRSRVEEYERANKQKMKLVKELNKKEEKRND